MSLRRDLLEKDKKHQEQLKQMQEEHQRQMQKSNDEYNDKVKSLLDEIEASNRSTSKKKDAPVDAPKNEKQMLTIYV